MKNRIAICGYGKVGKSLHKIFPQAEIYDPPLGFRNKDIVNNAEFNFICVPTPSKKNGSCDTSIVKEILRWSKADINIIRSTVSVGFTDKMIAKYRKTIIFMPEVGPSDFKNHPFNDLSKIQWAILGGDVDLSKKLAELWVRALYNVKIFYTNSKTAELLKLTENAYFYSKMIFFHNIYDICQKQGINYDELRQLLTEDFRIESDHSFIFPMDRKIAAKCLPKDLSNLINLAEKEKVDVRYFKLLEKLNNERD